MLVNLTNHPSSGWSSRQMDAACGTWKSVVDYPFPEVLPEADEKEIIREACAIADDVQALHPDAVLCQGEMSMAFTLVQLFQEKGIPVYAATSGRISEESVNADGSVEKKSVFQFIRFRRYPQLRNWKEDAVYGKKTSDDAGSITEAGIYFFEQ